MARVDFKDMIRFTDELVVNRKMFEGLELEPLETYMRRGHAACLGVQDAPCQRVLQTLCAERVGQNRKNNLWRTPLHGQGQVLRPQLYLQR